MPRVEFTPFLKRYLDDAPREVGGRTVREVFEVLFEAEPQLRSYLVDDQGALRSHVQVFVNEELVTDRVHLSDAVDAYAEIYVMQALSGG